MATRPGREARRLFAAGLGELGAATPYQTTPGRPRGTWARSLRLAPTHTHPNRTPACAQPSALSRPSPSRYALHPPLPSPPPPPTARLSHPQAISRGITKGGVAVETLNLEVVSLEEVAETIGRCNGFILGGWVGGVDGVNRVAVP